LYNPTFYLQPPQSIESIREELELSKKELEEIEETLRDLSNDGRQYGDAREQANHRAYLFERKNYHRTKIGDLEDELNSRTTSATSTPGALTHTPS
jgi:gas vesicle protein